MASQEWRPVHILRTIHSFGCYEETLVHPPKCIILWRLVQVRGTGEPEGSLYELWTIFIGCCGGNGGSGGT